ncbi:MAG: DUF4330 domain-containing protein [Clostridia bacterium]|nr:DUF4330 domain-containing protein [Clostridia bacterium]
MIKQNNKKRRFNVVDLLITAIILVVIAFLAYIFVFNSSFGTAGDDTVTIQYVLEVKDAYDMLTESAAKNVDKELIDAAAKFVLGTVKEFYTEPAVLSTYSHETGEATTSDYPEHSNFYFVVEAEAKREADTNRYMLDGFELSVGSRVYVRLPYYTGTSYCIEINEITK